MSAHRLSIVLLAFVGTLASDHAAQAGRFGDWLSGRNQAPYVVGYAPYSTSYTPYSAGYAPTVVTQSATMPLTQPVTTTPLSTGGPVNVAVTNGVFQAQRPSYDNPSVYTGMPVIMAPGPQSTFRIPVNSAPVQQLPTVSAYRPYLEARQQAAAANVPIARVLRGGAAATSNPFYGTGNVYPNNYQVNRYQSNYPVNGIAGTTVPGTPLPATTATPLFPNSPPYQPRVGGLARFFGSFWGTNYRTSYYRAPITYYRPVTSVDPITGSTVTVQQPCTSTVQQLQRTPYNSLFGQSPATLAPVTSQPCPTAGCPTPNCATPNTYLGGPAVNSVPLTGPSAYGVQPNSAYGVQPNYGGVGQVGGITSPSDRGVSPIPSTVDPSYMQQPNTQPLQGNPFGGGSGDHQPMPQPQLESAKPIIESGSSEETGTSEDDDSYWGRRDREEKTALNSISPKSVPSNHTYSDLRPIEAPSDYQSPFRANATAGPSAAQPLTAPPLLPSRKSNDQFMDLRGSTSASARVSVPVREATMTRTKSVAQPKQPKREYGGWQAK